MRLSLPVVGFFLCLPLLILLALFTTELKTDISAFVISGDNAEEILLASEIQSGTLSRRYILSIDAGPDHTVSTQFIHNFLKQLADIPGVTEVWPSNANRATFAALSEFYALHGASLYSRYPEQDLTRLFNEKALHDRAIALKQALLSPQAGLIKKLAVQDPLLLSLTGFKDLAGQFQKQARQPAQYANFILETAASGMNVPAQLQIQQRIQKTFAACNKSVSDAYELDMTGVALFAAATQSMMEKDIMTVSILSSIALTLLFLFIFRSFKVLFWVFSLLISVMCVAVIMTNLVFGSVHGMTLAIGSTLIGICIDYPIHALVHGQGLPEQQRIKSIKMLFPSLFMGAVTTLIGYIALGLSGYPGFQQVALYTGTGIIVSLLLTRYVFPRLMNAQAKPVKPFRWVTGWLTVSQQNRKVLLALVLLCTLFGIVQLDSLQWMQDLQQLTPELNYLKSNDKKIRERLVSMEPGRFVLLSADTKEALLQRAEATYKRLDTVQQAGKLDDYFGLYPWILSQQQQSRNQQLLLQTFNAQQQDNWHKALAATGLSVSHLGSPDYSQQNSLSLTELLNSPVAKLINNQLILKPQQNLLIIWLGAHEPQAVQAALANMSAVQYFSQRDMLNRMAVDYQHRAEITLLSGLALIGCLLLWRYKNPLITLQTLSPALLSALLMLSFWAWTGEAISFLHLVGFLLAVAICVDYGIFYQENRSAHLALTYQAMAASMLTSALVFGCLIVAQTSMLQTLAKVVSGGVILGFLLCPILINARKPELEQPH